MRAVISVIGKDKVGILAGVCAVCAECNMNVSDVTQSILQEMFVMIMIVEIKENSVPFEQFAERLKKYGAERNLDIHVMHEDIFNCMHQI